jgi:hypothetical protein
MTREPAALPVDDASIAAIVAMPPGSLRSHLVTQTYHQLATAVGEVLGGEAVNWFHFGTWASWSVGRIVTGEVFSPVVRRFLVGDADMLGQGHHRFRAAAAIEEVAAVVARDLCEGNIDVFSQMAPAGLAFVRKHTAASADEREAAATRLADLASSAAPVLGKQRLTLGFGAYDDALAENDPVRHTQLVLAGAIEMGAEEQSRLQPFVAPALCAGVTVAFTAIGDRLARTPLGRVRALARVGRAITDAVDRSWDRWMTHSFMVFEEPGERLHLGRDVPPVAGQPLIPPAVAKPVVPALVDVMAEFDRTHGSGVGDRSIDWALYADRMAWIAWFFLSRLVDQRLREPPFSDQQVLVLRAALIAAGLTLSPTAVPPV